MSSTEKATIHLEVTIEVMGYAWVYNYKSNVDNYNYLVPTYRMIVSVGNRKYCEYEVIRYGIDNKKPKTGGPAYASVCGLLEGKIFEDSKPGETYKIASWEPEYSSVSNPDTEKGAFRVQEGAKYLIHAGCSIHEMMRQWDRAAVLNWLGKMQVVCRNGSVSKLLSVAWRLTILE